MEPLLFNKIKDYEEFRLKELYEVILNDSGSSPALDKKFTMKPLGYSLN